MTVMMSDEVYEKITRFISVVANPDNWVNQELFGRIDGEWVRNEYIWVKDSYDPQYVAQDLLEQLPDEDE